MSIHAAQRMGLSCVSLDPSPDSPASQIAPGLVGPLNDAESLGRVIACCGMIALENEFIPADALDKAFSLAGRDPASLQPSLRTLAIIQDKLAQRKALLRAAVPSPAALSLEEEPQTAVAEIGFPMVLKARFGGYDGKGTRYAADLDQLEEYRYLWGPGGWLAEQRIEFRRELAVMVSRSRTATNAFPTMETQQKAHICDLVFPAGMDASDIAIAAVEAVEGYGLFGVELFEEPSGRLLVNEIAPRPHNTGHYTLDWGGASQFEEHVRLTMGWQSDCSSGIGTCMANLMGRTPSGDFRKGLEAAVREPGIHVHWYGKSESRPGRKMGHINAVGDNCRARATLARERFYEVWA